jgi:hypothetical protein
VGAQAPAQATEGHATVHLLERDEYSVVEAPGRGRVDVPIRTGHGCRTVDPGFRASVTSP